MAGAPDGALVAEAVWPCGARMLLPETSWKLTLQLAEVVGVHAALDALFAFRSVSTNDPGGSANWRMSWAEVTEFVAGAPAHSGVLSDWTGSVVEPVTLFTVQSPTAGGTTATNGLIRQTGSLYVTVTTFEATDIPV